VHPRTGVAASSGQCCLKRKRYLKSFHFLIFRIPCGISIKLHYSLMTREVEIIFSLNLCFCAFLIGHVTLCHQLRHRSPIPPRVLSAVLRDCV
jgi:hypothetical protein